MQLIQSVGTDSPSERRESRFIPSEDGFPAT